jgi:hypothetical protein
MRRWRAEQLISDVQMRRAWQAEQDAVRPMDRRPAWESSAASLCERRAVAPARARRQVDRRLVVAVCIQIAEQNIDDVGRCRSSVGEAEKLHTYNTRNKSPRALLKRVQAQW